MPAKRSIDAPILCEWERLCAVLAVLLILLFSSAAALAAERTIRVLLSPETGDTPLEFVQIRVSDCEGDTIKTPVTKFQRLDIAAGETEKSMIYDFAPRDEFYCIDARVKNATLFSERVLLMYREQGKAPGAVTISVIAELP